MRILILLILICLPDIAVCQTIYNVEGFSTKYHAEVIIDDATIDDTFRSGTISIFQTRTNRLLIEVYSDEFYFELDKGQVHINRRRMYDEQSLIIYDDFNFDGKKDLALQDGHHSCYHGPSYRIYLATKRGFRFSKPFTRLGQEYCGMFQTDPTDKRIRTMTKDGCCWHQYSEFVVINNIPKAVNIVEESAWSYPFIETTTQMLIKGRMQKSTVRYLFPPDDPDEIQLVYQLKGIGLRAIAIVDSDKNLIFAVVNSDNAVRLQYPTDAELEDDYAEPSVFVYTETATSQSLAITNNCTTYEIMQRKSNDSITLRITTKEKTQTFQGQPVAYNSSLTRLKDASPYNLKINPPISVNPYCRTEASSPIPDLFKEQR